jgi:hypothetical protein
MDNQNIKPDNSAGLRQIADAERKRIQPQSAF